MLVLASAGQIKCDQRGRKSPEPDFVSGATSSTLAVQSGAKEPGSRHPDWTALLILLCSSALPSEADVSVPCYLAHLFLFFFLPDAVCLPPSCFLCPGASEKLQ